MPPAAPQPSVAPADEPAEAERGAAVVACRRWGRDWQYQVLRAGEAEAVWTAARDVPRQLIDDFQRRLELVSAASRAATSGAAASSAASAVPPRKRKGGGWAHEEGDA